MTRFLSRRARVKQQDVVLNTPPSSTGTVNNELLKTQEEPVLLYYFWLTSDDCFVWTGRTDCSGYSCGHSHDCMGRGSVKRASRLLCFSCSVDSTKPQDTTLPPSPQPGAHSVVLLVPHPWGRAGSSAELGGGAEGGEGWRGV